MSATINCREFAEYFGTPIQGKMNPAYVFEVEGAPYAIEEFYLDDLYKEIPYRVRKLLMFAELFVCIEAKLVNFGILCMLVSIRLTCLI